MFFLQLSSAKELRGGIIFVNEIPKMPPGKSCVGYCEKSCGKCIRINFENAIKMYFCLPTCTINNSLKYLIRSLCFVCPFIARDHQKCGDSFPETFFLRGLRSQPRASRNRGQRVPCMTCYLTLNSDNITKRNNEINSSYNNPYYLALNSIITFVAYILLFFNIFCYSGNRNT